MIDIYRFFLATFVLQAHLWAYGSGPLSQYAVFSFYVLSGFLMTMILNESYGFGTANFFRFWTNRLLRLYPAYFIVIAITFFHIVFVSPLNGLEPRLGIPVGSYDLVRNIVIFGIAGVDSTNVPQVNFIPNAWSLSVELFCYFLLSIFFAMKLRYAVSMLLIGLAITIPELVRVSIGSTSNYDFQNHYGVIQAGIIPFAAGSIAYFYRQSHLFAFSRTRVAVLLLGWVINCVLAHTFIFHRFVSGLYVAAALNFLLVPMLFNWDLAARPARLRKVLGGISYPMFVSHFLIGSLLWRYAGFKEINLQFFVLASVATVLFSLVVHLFVERKIEVIRTMIKRRRMVAPAWQESLSAPSSGAAG